MSDIEIGELYAASYPRLLGQLIAVTGSAGEAEDVLQEAFVRGLDPVEERDVRRADARQCRCRTVLGRLASHMAR